MHKHQTQAAPRHTARLARRDFTRRLAIGAGGLATFATFPAIAQAASLQPSIPDGPFLQDGWRWCRKCQGLFYSLNSTWGACPAGGGHDPAGSAALALHANDSTTAGQRGWKWCHQCQGLFFPEANNQNGSCPGAFNVLGAFRQGHDMTGSADYTVWVQSHDLPGPPDPLLVDFELVGILCLLSWALVHRKRDAWRLYCQWFRSYLVQ